MVAVALQGVGKNLSGRAILHPLDLQVEKGEFVVIIGPSGSGKSTLLRLVAGLDSPSMGEIWMNERSIRGVPPSKRDIAMVFQDYALYPHMTVFENMAYGLRMRRFTDTVIRARVQEVAQSLGLSELLDRKPQSLSGGQQQRVAMGRALVRQPSLFLFDEPLSNLDLSLRSQLRVDMKQRHQAMPITSLYVTHDQVEAMTLATRIVVLNEGRLEQFDTPQRLYHEPASLFVGSFMGLYSMNLLPGHLEVARGTVETLGGVRLPLPPLSRQCSAGEKVWIGIRPEDMQVASSIEEGPCLAVDETLVDDMGADLLVRVVTQSGQVPALIRLSAGRDGRATPIQFITFRQLKAHIFLASSGERIGGWDGKEGIK